MTTQTALCACCVRSFVSFALHRRPRRRGGSDDDSDNDIFAAAGRYCVLFLFHPHSSSDIYRLPVLAPLAPLLSCPLLLLRSVSCLLSCLVLLVVATCLFVFPLDGPATSRLQLKVNKLERLVRMLSKAQDNLPEKRKELDELKAKLALIDKQHQGRIAAALAEKHKVGPD